MEILFDYRPNNIILNTNIGDIELKFIRKCQRGIVSIISYGKPIVIWDSDVANSHVNDSEIDLQQRTINVLNNY